MQEGKKVPSNKQLTQWLISGTAAQKDEAASLLYTKSQREGKHFMDESHSAKSEAASHGGTGKWGGRQAGSVAQAGTYGTIAQGIVDAVHREGH